MGQYHGCWWPGDLSPGHQQPRYWWYKKGSFFSSLRTNFSSLHPFIVQVLYETQTHIIVFSKRTRRHKELRPIDGDAIEHITISLWRLLNELLYISIAPCWPYETSVHDRSPQLCQEVTSPFCRGAVACPSRGMVSTVRPTMMIPSNGDDTAERSSQFIEAKLLMVAPVLLWLTQRDYSWQITNR